MERSSSASGEGRLFSVAAAFVVAVVVIGCAAARADEQQWRPTFAFSVATASPLFNSELWVSAPGRAPARLIRTKTVGIEDPAWAHTSERIVFTVVRDPLDEAGKRLFIADPDGSHRRRLTHEKRADEYTPSWSPDDRMIAYARSLGPDVPSLWLIRPDGRARRRLTYGWHPSWSPDSQWIVFTDENVLWLIRRNGGGRHRLTPPPGPECDFSGGESADYEGAADWSPDGGAIAFVRYCGSGEEPHVDRVFVIRSDGTGLRPLTPGPRDDSPSWSPDGRRVAFVDNGLAAVIGRDGRGSRTFFTPPPQHGVLQLDWHR